MTKLSEQGDKARKALHDMRWGPHIEDVVERQEAMDNAIKTALHAVAALEQNVAASEAALEINDGFLTGVEEKLEKAEQRVEHFERFKLYLSVMGGIDVDHAWGATEREEEE